MTNSTNNTRSFFAVYCTSTEATMGAGETPEAAIADAADYLGMSQEQVTEESSHRLHEVFGEYTGASMESTAIDSLEYAECYWNGTQK